MGHGMRLTALIASLLATGYPYIDIVLLDTDVNVDSLSWMRSTANVFNPRNTEPRNVVHVSTEFTQRYVQERFPLIQKKEYG
jgi:hypothetical protein